MIVDFILLLIFGAYLATYGSAGIWTNLINVINLITASLLALNYFEPLAGWLETKDGSYTYLVDFVILWGLFAVIMGLLRAATDYLSKFKVRFKRAFDVPIGALLACWAAWILVSFTAVALHPAPLSQNFLGFMRDPETRTLFGLGPDHRLLGFMQKESQGALGRTVTFKNADGTTTYGPRKFDPRGEYILKYGDRRARLEKHYQSTGSLRVTTP